MPRNEEFDWIFDYTLQFLESDKFDAALMDFVDEKCLVFEDVEENKLVYTDIHREFCEHVESLISTYLAEVGITTELFLESCDKARSGRGINTTVFERLMAMEDFNTFKKLMTKRNIELQMESIRSFIATTNGKAEAKVEESKSQAKSSSKDDEVGKQALSQLEKDELEALHGFAFDDADFDNMTEEEIQDMLFQSLVEMELLHRQEELEHAELERALLLSLALEEERLSSMLSDLTAATVTLGNSIASTVVAEEKADFVSARDESSQQKVSSAPSPAELLEAKEIDFKSSDNHRPVVSSSTSSTISNTGKSKLSLAPLAPISGLRLRGEAKPLPSIGHNPQVLAAELEEKKKAAEDAIKRSADQLAVQRRREEELRATVNNIDSVEADRRAQHMQRQRELLLAKKKAERDSKVQQEAEFAASPSKAESKADVSPRVLDAKTVSALLQERTAEEKEVLAQGASVADVAELRRQNLRLALAKRLKNDVRQDEVAKQTAIQDSQFAELDQRLKQVEELREENRKRDMLVARQLERQKEQIARNIELSAAALRANNDNR